MSEPGKITLLLRRIDEGDADANEELYRLVETDLKRIVWNRMKGFGSGNFSTTAIVDLAFFRLVRGGKEDWSQGGRRKFFGFASKKIESILIDEWRKQNAGKIPPEEMRVDFTEKAVVRHTAMVAGGDFGLDLKIALEDLEARGKKEEVEIFRIRYFLDSTFEEITEVIGNGSVSTIQRKYKYAAQWVWYRLRDYFPNFEEESRDF